MTGIRLALGWVGPPGQTLVSIIEASDGAVSDPFRRDASHRSDSPGASVATQELLVASAGRQHGAFSGRITPGDHATAGWGCSVAQPESVTAAISAAALRTAVRVVLVLVLTMLVSGQLSRPSDPSENRSREERRGVRRSMPRCVHATPCGADATPTRAAESKECAREDSNLRPAVSAIRRLLDGLDHLFDPANRSEFRSETRGRRALRREQA